MDWQPLTKVALDFMIIHKDELLHEDISMDSSHLNELHYSRTRLIIIRMIPPLPSHHKCFLTLLQHPLNHWCNGTIRIIPLAPLIIGILQSLSYPGILNACPVS